MSPFAGAKSEKVQLSVGNQLNSLLDYCHGLQEGARAVVKSLHPKGLYPQDSDQLVRELSKAPAHIQNWKSSSMRRAAIRVLALAKSYYPATVQPALLSLGKPEEKDDGTPFTDCEFRQIEHDMRPFGSTLAAGIVDEKFCHYYNEKNERVSPPLPTAVDFGRPSRATSSAPTSATPAAPVPSRVVSTPPEASTTSAATGVEVETPQDPARASTSTAPSAEPEKTNPLDDF